MVSNSLIYHNLAFFFSFAVQITSQGRFKDAVDNNCKVFTECTLTCDVSVMQSDLYGSLIPLAPLVSWEHYARDGNWWKLSDDYWWENDGIHYSSQQGQNICMKEDGVYRCKFVQTYCCSPRFEGHYRCNITVGHVRGTIYQSEDIQLSKYEVTLGKEGKFSVE